MKRRCWQWIWTGVLVGMMFMAAPGLAQSVGDREAPLKAGIEALEAGRIEAAIESLERIFEDDPAYLSATYGAAGYWLGRTYEADEDLESAREVWRESIVALTDAGRFDPRLSDVFVRQTFAAAIHDDYPLATMAYLDLLASATQARADVAGLVQTHLEELALILPASIKKQTGVDQVEQAGLSALKPEAGLLLAAWWRSRDVAPATRNNERLEEHLQRVAYARAHYVQTQGRQKGAFDERAEVYIRLGAPSRSTSVDFSSTAFRNKVTDRSLTLHSSDFPENEFWFYEHIADAAQFLFINKGNGFRLGETRDLLPPAVRNGMGNSARGQSKARATVRTMEEVLRQLSLYHPDFGPRYQDVAAFSSLLDEEEFATETASIFQTEAEAVQVSENAPEVVREAAAASAGSNPFSTVLSGGSFPVNRPDLFATSFLSQNHVEDEQTIIQREEEVPDSYSNAFDDVEDLPIIVRHARFLDPDGTTRTEVYWGVPVGGMHLSKKMRKAIRKENMAIDDYMLLGTLVQKSATYQERVVNYKRHVVPDIGDGADAALAPHTYTVKGDTGTYHLALQWDQYTASLDANNQPVGLGMRVKATTYHADTLQALSSDERILEMSDIKPMAVLDADNMAPTDAMLDAAVLYPFNEIQSTTPLFLYFEVYHLNYDTDDRTRYTIAYEVVHHTDGGLFRKDKKDRIAASTEYTGSSRTTPEYLLLDLADWEGEGTLDVTVRITDEVTGQQVERTLSFQLVDG
jgi:GWxTD domain-containing protein